MEDEDDPLEHGFVEAQVYDFFKHLSTLSLISIGGILGLIRDDVVDVPRSVTLLSLGCIALAAFLGLTSNSAIAGASSSGKPLNLNQLGIIRTLSLFAYLFGVGVFVGAFSLAI